MSANVQIDLIRIHNFWLQYISLIFFLLACFLCILLNYFIILILSYFVLTSFFLF